MDDKPVDSRLLDKQLSDKTSLDIAPLENQRFPGAREAKFGLGQVVRHRLYPFRGVVFDIDPCFDNTEEWYEAIPEDKRPERDQPFYHLFAENLESEYIAYVSEQNLEPDTSGEPVRHPMVAQAFDAGEPGQYRVPGRLTN